MAQITGNSMNAGERNRIEVGAGPGYVHVKTTNQQGSSLFNIADVELSVDNAEHLVAVLQAAIVAAKR